MAGGPGSTKSLSNFPCRVGNATFNCGMFKACDLNFTGGRSPAFISTGVQFTRSSDIAAQICVSPQYIQYLPLIFVATGSPFLYVETTEPDLLHLPAYFPLNALANTLPCFFQCTRSVEVATSSRALWPS